MRNTLCITALSAYTANKYYGYNCVNTQLFCDQCIGDSCELFMDDSGGKCGEGNGE